MCASELRRGRAREREGGREDGKEGGSDGRWEGRRGEGRERAAVILVPVQKDFVKLQDFLVHFQFGSAAVARYLEYDRLWVLFNAADERILVVLSRSWECIDV